MEDEINVADVLEKWSYIVSEGLMNEVLTTHIFPLLLTEIQDIWLP